jgi:hypothetical protein
MPATTPERTIDWPLWWFVRLEAALERGDHAEAAEAQRQLQRLGVDVRYRARRLRPPPPSPPSGQGGRHA